MLRNNLKFPCSIPFRITKSSQAVILSKSPKRLITLLSINHIRGTTFLSCAEEALGILEVVCVLAGHDGDGGVAGHVGDTLHLDPGPLHAHQRGLIYIQSISH
jgi:hypothetical protein